MARFDRCVKTKEDEAIWMVREKTKSRVMFVSWEEYVEAGMPEYDIISADDLDQYREAGYFRG